MLHGDDLAAFVAVAREMHFGRASDQLGTAQSVVSKRLKRLEAALGFELLDRSNRFKLTLTPQGRILLSQAGDALREIRQFETIGRNIKRGAAGPLRVGYVFSAALNGSVTKAISSIRETCNPVDLELRLMETPRQIEAIEAGEINIAIIRPHHAYPWPSLHAEVHSEPLLVAGNRDDDLFALPSIRVADLEGRRLIVPQYPNESSLSPVLVHLVQQAGLKGISVISTGDFISAACLASAGEGIILGPGSLESLHMPGLHFRPLADLPMRLRLVMLWRPDTPRAAVDAILQTMSARR